MALHDPSLEELGLIRAEYIGLDELAEDDSAFADAPSELRDAPPETRKRALTILLDVLRKGLAATSDALDQTHVDNTANAARQYLQEPWSISREEKPRIAAALILAPLRRAEIGVRNENLVVRGSSRSSLARQLNRAEIWERRLSADRYVEVLEALLAAASEYQLVRSVATAFDVEGWRLAANAVRLVASDGRADGKTVNPFFVQLYETLSGVLLAGGENLFGLEAREHTAQVDQERRECANGDSAGETTTRRSLRKKRTCCGRKGNPLRSFPPCSVPQRWNSESTFRH